MSTGKITSGRALVDHGITVQKQLDQLTEYLVNLQFPPDHAAVATGPEQQSVDPGPSRPGWLSAILALRPVWQAALQKPIELMRSHNAKTLENLREVSSVVLEGTRKLAEDAPVSISDPFVIAAAYLPKLEKGRKVLKGTAAEGIISEAYLGQLREFLAIHAAQRLGAALAQTNRQGPLTATLEQAATVGWKASGPFTPDQHKLLIDAHAQLQTVRGIEEPGKKAKQILELRQHLSPLWRLKHELPGEVLDDLSAWQKALDPVPWVIWEFPQLVGK